MVRRNENGSIQCPQRTTPRSDATGQLHPGVDPATLSNYEIDHDHYDKGSDQPWEVVHSHILLRQPPRQMQSGVWKMPGSSRLAEGGGGMKPKAAEGGALVRQSVRLLLDATPAYRKGFVPITSAAP